MSLMEGRVLHGFEHETIEAKAAWFGTLTIEERLRHLDTLYRLAVGLDPKLREGRDARSPSATVRVLKLPAR